MKVTNVFFGIILTLVAFSCTQTSEEITKTDLIGSWEELNQNLLDTFPVGEVLNFNEDGSFKIENSYLAHNNLKQGKWAFDEISSLLTYNYGGDTIQGIPTVKYISELQIISLDGNKMEVNYIQKAGIAKFIRPKRVYQKRE